jgi:chemotaxis response regulator CheB
MPQRSPEALRGAVPPTPAPRPTSAAVLAFAGALASGNPPPLPARPGPAFGADRPDLVVVGISTGGPHTLPTFLGGLRGFEPPVIVAQHIPEVFSRSLAAMLGEGRVPRDGVGAGRARSPRRSAARGRRFHWAAIAGPR